MTKTTDNANEHGYNEKKMEWNFIFQSVIISEISGLTFS